MGHRDLLRDVLPVGLLTLAALAVRLVDLGRLGLWFDETYTAWIAGLPAYPAWQALVADGVHPPLYYALARLVAAFGSSEFAFRLPSALAGGLTVPICYALGRLTVGRRAGLAAAGLLAAAPFHVWQSRDARMYALLALLSTAGILSYWVMVRRRTPAWRLWFCLAHAAAYLTHYFGLFMPLVELVDLIVHFRTRGKLIRQWTALQAVSALPLAAWIFVLFRREAQFFGIGWIPAVSLADLGWTLLNFTLGVPGTVQPWQWIALAGFLALIAIGLGRTWPDGDSKAILAAWALLPMTVTLLLSLRRPLYMDRFLLGSLPGLLLLAAAGWSALARTPRLVVGPLLGAALAVSLVRFVFVPGAAKEDWREAARILAGAEPGETVIARQLQLIVPFSYYPPGSIGIQVLEANRVAQPLDELAAGYDGIWLVYWNAAADAHRIDGGPAFDPAGETDPTAADWLAGEGPPLAERIDLNGITLLHFVRRP